MGIALIAGSGPAPALVAGTVMMALQVSIGAYNDLMDVSSDARSRPSKPIPGGDVSRATAIRVMTGGLVIGLLLATILGSIAFAIAAAGVGCGYVHSRWTKGTPFAVVPFAIGTALLPTFAWIVGTGQPPPAAIIALGAAGGIAIGLANAGSDLDADGAIELRTPAVRLGRRRTNTLVTAILAMVAMAAIVTMVALRPGPVAVGLSLAGLGLIGLGVAVAWRPVTRPQLSWELDAAGLAILATAWLSAASGAG